MLKMSTGMMREFLFIPWIFFKFVLINYIILNNVLQIAVQ